MSEQRLVNFVNAPVLLMAEDRGRDTEVVQFRSMLDWREHPRYEARNLMIHMVLTKTPVHPWVAFYRDSSDAGNLIDEWLRIISDREFPPTSVPQIHVGPSKDLVLSAIQHVEKHDLQVYVVAQTA